MMKKRLNGSESENLKTYFDKLTEHQTTLHQQCIDITYSTHLKRFDLKWLKKYSKLINIIKLQSECKIVEKNKNDQTLNYIFTLFLVEILYRYIHIKIYFKI